MVVKGKKVLLVEIREVLIVTFGVQLYCKLIN